MRPRYVARVGEMSPLLRYVARLPDMGRDVATPSENIYSFPLNDLAEASADIRKSWPGNCLSGARWVIGYKLLLGRKINPRSHTKSHEVAQREEISC
jgi:hypothetical protein